MTRIGVITFPGTLDDVDAARAVRGRDLADGVLGHGARPFYHYLMHCAKKGCCTKVSPA